MSARVLNNIFVKATHMTIGRIFFVIAAIVLFIGGIGSTIVPNAVIWGLFCIAVGLVLGEYDIGFNRRR
jgi:hypothetical protein